MNLRKNLLLFILIFATANVFAQDGEKEDGFKIGGAMRFNLLSTNYESGASNLNPQFTWDTWRLNVDGSMGGIDLSFEYIFVAKL